MKHLLSALVAAVTILLPVVTQAAGAVSMSFDTTSYSVEKGKQFEVTVAVNPNGESLDTVRAVVTFDPLVLQIQNVALVGAFDRVAPGNYYDNATGKISWGAFTLEGPVATSSEFMKITFMSIAEGNGKIEVSPDSRAISNGEEKIDLASLGSAQVEVKAPTAIESGLALMVVESENHANESEWYANNTVKLSWMHLQGRSPITAYYYSFDESIETGPTTYLPSKKTELTLENVKDGAHYFHIKGVQEDGNQTAVVHRRVNVDTTAPHEIELMVQDNKILEGETAWFTFATIDDTSGVVQYQIAINDSAYQVQESPLEITDLKAGTYFVRVAALDRASNVSYGSTSVRVYPKETGLDRPEGYEENAELKAIAEALNREDWWMGFWVELAAGLMAVVAVVAGAYGVYKIKSKK